MIDDGDCEAIGGMQFGRGNRSTRRKPTPVPLCPPQIQHDLIQAQTRAAGVGSQRLTASAMARPHTVITTGLYIYHALPSFYKLRFWIRIPLGAWMYVRTFLSR
jgi:hypothetical protein